MYWTADKVEALKKYWQIKTNEELAAMFGTTQSSIANKASRLNLSNGTHRKFGKVAKEYNPGPETIKETQGRRCTNEIQNIKNSMHITDKIKLQQYVSKKTGYQPKRGKIVGITDHFIVLQTRNYKECFRLTDFLTRRTILEA